MFLFFRDVWADAISPDKLRVVKVVGCVCYLAHVTCCILCLIGVSEQARGEENWIDSNDYSHLPSLSIYLRGYFWAIYTIVTVGFGSIGIVTSLEKIFAMSVMIVGAIMCDAGITAMLSSIIANADKLSGATRRSKEGMQQFCRSHRYSEDIQNKVALYYDYLASDLKNSVEEQDFRMLPAPLRVEFAQQFAFDALCSLCLLDTEDSDARLGFVYSLLRHVELTVAVPGQIILGVGGLDIHVLRRGKAYARLAGQESLGTEGKVKSRRNYFQEGEALCREGRLNTTAAMSPGKLVAVTLHSFESVQCSFKHATMEGSSRDCGDETNRFQQGKGDMDIKNSVKNFMSARRGSITRRGSGFERYLGRATSMAGSQTSTAYARLSCGARKMSSSFRPYSTPVSSPNTSSAVCWNEDFTFHVPKAASSLKILFFDNNKQNEDNGYFGCSEIKFSDLERMPLSCRTTVRESNSCADDETENCGDDLSDDESDFFTPNKKYKQTTRFENELSNPSISCNVDDSSFPGQSFLDVVSPLPPDDHSFCEGDDTHRPRGEKNSEQFPSSRKRRAAFASTPSTSSFSRGNKILPESSSSHRQDDADEKKVYTYRVKHGVRDDLGKIKGYVDVEITVRGAGIADHPVGRKKAMALEHSKQLSRTPTEVIAESFCHLVTIPTDKLTKLRSFYGDLLESSVSTHQLANASLAETSTSTKFSSTGSSRNFKTAIFSSSKTGLSVCESNHSAAMSVHDTTLLERMNSCDSTVSNISCSNGAAQQGRRGSTYSSLSNNHMLRRMSCAAIASSMDAMSFSDVISEENCRRHSSEIHDVGTRSEDRGDQQNSHVKKIRRLSLVLSTGTGSDVSKGNGGDGDSYWRNSNNSSTQLCSDLNHTFSDVKTDGMKSKTCNPYNSEDEVGDFDTDISDNEMEEAFGLASLAQNLRKDSNLEKKEFQFSWV